MALSQAIGTAFVNWLRANRALVDTPALRTITIVVTVDERDGQPVPHRILFRTEHQMEQAAVRDLREVGTEPRARAARP